MDVKNPVITVSSSQTMVGSWFQGSGVFVVISLVIHQTELGGMQEHVSPRAEL